MKEAVISRKETNTGKAVANQQTKSTDKSITDFHFIHPKLTIGQPNDKYEKEADMVADRVMSMPEPAEPQKLSSGYGDQEIQSKPILQMISPFVQRQATEEEEEPVQTKPDIHKQENEEEEEVLQAKPAILKQEEEEEPVQTRSEISGNHDLTGHPTHSVSAESLQLERTAETGWFTNELTNSKNSGAHLPEAAKEEMEGRFGTDFSNVRIHTGSNAVSMSQSINAQAFTTGNDIYFNSGKFEPGTKAGRHLLAHELTHTIQQGGGAKKLQQSKIQRIPASPSGTPFQGTVFRNAHLREGPSRTSASLEIVPRGTTLSVLGGDEYLNVIQFIPVFRMGYIHSSLISRGTSFTNVTDTGNRYTSNLTLYNNTIEITKKVNFVNGGGFTSTSRFNRLKRRVQRAIRSYLSRKFSLRVSTPPPGTRQAGDRSYPIVVYVAEDSAGYSITLMGNAHGRSSASTGGATLFELGQASESHLPNITIAHEAGHFVLGQSDEYANAAVPGRVVRTDHSLMGHFYNEGITKARLKSRHFQFVIPVVQPWFPGRNLAIV